MMELMGRSQQEVVLERVMGKLETIDRVVAEKRAGRLESNEGRETKWVIDRVLGVVGVDFV